MSQQVTTIRDVLLSVRMLPKRLYLHNRQHSKLVASPFVLQVTAHSHEDCYGSLQVLIIEAGCTLVSKNS
jgi:hypothetical protein